MGRELARALRQATRPERISKLEKAANVDKVFFDPDIPKGAAPHIRNLANLRFEITKLGRMVENNFIELNRGNLDNSRIRNLIEINNSLRTRILQLSKAGESVVKDIFNIAFKEASKGTSSPLEAGEKLSKVARKISDSMRRLGVLSGTFPALFKGAQIPPFLEETLSQAISEREAKREPPID